MGVSKEMSHLKTYIMYLVMRAQPIPVAARSKAWVCCRWLAEIAGSNPAGGVDVSLSRECCVLSGEEISATG